MDYLTQQSPVRTRVDPNRLAVSGHSMGGGDALNAAIRRPSLKATVGIAPFLPSSNLANDRVPTMLFSGQADTVVTPSSVVNQYNSLPATTESVYLEVAGGDHGFMGRSAQHRDDPDHAAVPEDVRRQRQPVQPVPLPAAGLQRRGHLPQ
ncbi:alpha/beta hydrolase [Micromonosporaceae bacterium B7E4]